MTDEKRERKKLVREIIEQFRKRKNSMILYVDGKDIFAKGSAYMFTYSSNFYNDYANYEMAKYMTPLVFYGNSITQGTSALRSGNIYPNIVSRYLDADIVNYSFSGACKGEKNMARQIAEKICLH